MNSIERFHANEAHSENEGKHHLKKLTVCGEWVLYRRQLWFFVHYWRQCSIRWWRASVVQPFLPQGLCDSSVSTHKQAGPIFRAPFAFTN